MLKRLCDKRSVRNPSIIQLMFCSIPICSSQYTLQNNNIYMQSDTVRHIIMLASISCAHSVQRLRIIFIFVIESAVSITLLYDLYNDGVFLRL